ncbi:hypothetical protein VTK26DRAFT_6215 [Humicola hyalothermophila]
MNLPLSSYPRSGRSEASWWLLTEVGPVHPLHSLPSKRSIYSSCAIKQAKLRSLLFEWQINSAHQRKGSHKSHVQVKEALGNPSFNVGQELRSLARGVVQPNCDRLALGSAQLRGQNPQQGGSCNLVRAGYGRAELHSKGFSRNTGS